jgi:hypothetical protein
MQDKIKRIIKKQKRKSFDIKSLEKSLVKTFKDETAYNSAGGYKAFAKAILSLENKGLIREIKASPYYYKKPYIKSKYIRIDERAESSWDAYTFIIYSNLLDLSYFKTHEKEQNDLNLKYIQRIYAFIQKRDKRFLASREERALEIFDDEKYFTTSENLLKKIKLNPNLAFENFDEALKMQKNTQMFVFFENKGISNNRMLILENQSTFFAVKRLSSENISFFKRDYQLIIWGQGKGIIKQLEMLSRITDPKAVVIDYFGDIDPEGYFIFLKLKEKFPDLKINLLEEAYKALLEVGKFYSYHQKQNKNSVVLEDILEFFKNEKHQELIKRLWEENLRIPQEIITYEYIKRREK